MNRRTLLLGTGAALALPALPALAQQATVTGAGATFPRPVYERWGQQAREAVGIQLNYQSIGSGGGVNQITNRTVDFGATDAPLAEAQLRERNLLQFPTVMGSVVQIVNLPGVADNALRLTPELLADIYLGRITRWNDPRLVEANRDIRLPNLPVSPTYRADASGTDLRLHHLPLPRSPTGSRARVPGTSVQWPVARARAATEGVSNTVARRRVPSATPENAYADRRTALSPLSCRNMTGNSCPPTMESFMAAAEQATGTGRASRRPDRRWARATWPDRLARPSSCCRPTRRRTGSRRAAPRCASSTGPSATARRRARPGVHPCPVLGARCGSCRLGAAGEGTKRPGALAHWLT
jgi:phosphate transport system substrate-binding protein